MKRYDLKLSVLDAGIIRGISPRDIEDGAQWAIYESAALVLRHIDKSRQH